MASKAVYAGRLKRLRKAVEGAGLAGVVMAPGPNIRYFTGVDSLLTERPLLLLVPVQGEVHVVVPELEAGPYRDCPIGISVHSWTDSSGPSKAFRASAGVLKKRSKWGVEGRMPFQYYDKLKKYSSVRLREAEPILQGLRETKDATEVSLMRKAGGILSKSFEHIPLLIQEGISEIDLGRKLSDLIYSNGATHVEELLVQSGPRAAVPHSHASPRKIGSGETVVLDLVMSYEGYFSDITRTFCIGSSKEIEKVYDKVLEAQARAIAAAGEGVSVGKVDAAARRYLSRAGLGKYFIHRTGHGLGLEVHEAPYIVEGGKERLGRNMFFTVEPGVYFPGKLGVRIEDNVMIVGGRAVEITTPPKEYGWWN